MIETTLKQVKKGDYFTRKPIQEPNEKQVFIKRDYVRSDKKYICERFNDMNDYIELKSDTKVYVDFYF